MGGQSASEGNTTPQFPAYSGKIRSLTAQKDTLQKCLKAAMATNTHLASQLQQLQGTPGQSLFSTAQSTPHLQTQVTSLTQAMASLKMQHHTAIDSLSSDNDKSLMELRSEIETLHAEHAHDTAVTQNELQAKTGENRLLKQDLAACKAKVSRTSKRPNWPTKLIVLVSQRPSFHLWCRTSTTTYRPNSIPSPTSTETSQKPRPKQRT